MNEIENDADRVRAHYTHGDLAARIEQVLGAAGTTPSESALAGMDQFHVRGLEATQELANSLELTGGETVLDVGCGLGGPARFFAATHGCRVTGIDLTPAYIEAALLLAQKTGLSALLTFVQGDALHLPFADAAFDHAYTQHVAMNIADKDRLYREMYRVLKPGGRLALYDPVRGENDAPVLYPVPWARTPSTSFLAAPGEIAGALEHAGFGILSVRDQTPPALAWFAARQAPPPPPGEWNLGTVMGPDFPLMFATLAQNVREKRVGFVQIVAQKAGKK